MEEINAYLGNTLTPAQKAAFEQRMNEDASLAQAVEQERKAVKQLVENFFERKLSREEEEVLQQRREKEAHVQEAYQEEYQLEQDTDLLIEIHQWLETQKKVSGIFANAKEDLLDIYKSGLAEGQTSPPALVKRIPFTPPTQAEETSERKSQKFKWLKPAMYLAAACLALLFALNLGNQHASNFTNTALSSKYLDITNPPNSGITLSPEAHEQGIAQFDSGHYEQAIELFIQVPDTSEDYAKIRFLLAYAYLKSAQDELAIDIYQRIIATENDIENPLSQYIDRARWYLSLTYLKQSKEEEAKTLLKEISTDQDNYMYQSAQNLLDDLSSMFRKVSSE